MNKILLIPTAIILLQSCAFLIDIIDNEVRQENNSLLVKTKNKKTYCSENSNFTISNDNKKSQVSFKRFIKENPSLNKGDKLLLWAILQTNLRPDLSGPNSKFQFFLKRNNQTFYRHFYSDSENAFPFFYGLEKLQPLVKSSLSIKEIISIYDEKINFPLEVSINLEMFLNREQAKIKSDLKLKKIYFRGDEHLKATERLKKQKLSKLYDKYLLTKNKFKYSSKTKLFKYKKNDFVSASCNYNMSLYNNSVYLINSETIRSHGYTFQEENLVFIANNGLERSSLSTLDKTIFLKGKSKARPSGMCHYKFHLPGKELILASTNSRDPGQHLFHLLEYGLQDVNHIEQLDSLLKFSRHLFLKNPIRLLLESGRSTNEQLRELLKLDISIYNKSNLGNLYGQFSNNQMKKIIIDVRNNDDISCMIR